MFVRIVVHQLSMVFTFDKCSYSAYFYDHLCGSLGRLLVATTGTSKLQLMVLQCFKRVASFPT